MRSNTAITEGVKISVETKFLKDFSDVIDSKYIFKYRIKVQNYNSYPVKLFYRDWLIFDSLDDFKHVSGAGVVGNQPILQSGESFEYESFCNLVSDYGYMKGHYTFINLEDGSEFPVFIPKFDLIYPFKLN